MSDTISEKEPTKLEHDGADDALILPTLFPSESYSDSQVYWADLARGDRGHFVASQFNQESAREVSLITFNADAVRCNEFCADYLSYHSFAMSSP